MTTFNPKQYNLVERDVYSAGAEAYEKYGSRAFEAYAQPLLDGAGLAPGLRVLDVACGPAIPSLEAARRVAPTGTVTGIDLAPGMVALAAKKARERGITNARFEQGDAESLPFPDGGFDRVLCSHGLVHMTDRAKGLREMRRVLKPGAGVLAVSTWSTPDRTLPLGIVAKTVRELRPQAIEPGAPTWFDFGPEGALEQALSLAGFDEVRVARHNVPLVIESPGAFWDAVLGISGRLKMLLANIPEEAAQNIRSAVLLAAEDFRSGDAIIIPCEEVIGKARI